MKKWIAALVMAGMLTAVPCAEAFHVSGTIHGFHHVASSIEVIAVPTTLDTFFILIPPLILFPPFILDSTYSFNNMDSGTYIMFSYQDLNVNLTPDLDEPRGFFGDGSLPSLLQIDHDSAGVDITLHDPTSGGFTGHVTYNGQQTGTKLIVASRNSDFSGFPNGAGVVLFDSTGAGSYTAFVDSFGTYYAYAYMDVNGNVVYDADEPYGVYGGDHAEAMDIQPLNFPSNIDIVLTDPVPSDSGGFSGHVTYHGDMQGTRRVVASRNADFSGSPRGGGIVEDTTQIGYYTAAVDSYGVYYAYAYLDVNGNHGYDTGEPFGIFGGDRAAEINVQPDNFPTDVDIVLLDPIESVGPQAPLPSTTAISEIYPNPFNATATIRFSVAKTTTVELTVYNMLGRKVKTLAEGIAQEGEHAVQFEGTDLPSGVYVVQLKTAAGSVNQKMMLLK